jgi:hypothetical protein
VVVLETGGGALCGLLEASAAAGGRPEDRGRIAEGVARVLAGDQTHERGALVRVRSLGVLGARTLARGFGASFSSLVCLFCLWVCGCFHFVMWLLWRGGKLGA